MRIVKRYETQQGRVSYFLVYVFWSSSRRFDKLVEEPTTRWIPSPKIYRLSQKNSIRFSRLKTLEFSRPKMVENCVIPRNEQLKYSVSMPVCNVHLRGIISVERRARGDSRSVSRISNDQVKRNATPVSWSYGKMHSQCLHRKTWWICEHPVIWALSPVRVLL